MNITDIYHVLKQSRSPIRTRYILSVGANKTYRLPIFILPWKIHI